MMSHAERRILLLNVPEQVGRTVRYYAQEIGWSVAEDTTHGGFVSRIRRHDYALILMDISELKQEGYTFCKSVVHAVRGQKPVLLLSDGGVAERVKAFEAGADDCISKPFGIRELFCRMNVLMNRSVEHSGDESGPTFHSRLLSATLQLEQNRLLMWIDRSPVRLSRREYKVMKVLTEHINRTITREELVHRVWQTQNIGYVRTVDANIKRIREKLKQISPDLAAMIRTERGIGYCLMDLASITG